MDEVLIPLPGAIASALCLAFLAYSLGKLRGRKGGETAGHIDGRAEVFSELGWPGINRAPFEGWEKYHMRDPGRSEETGFPKGPILVKMSGTDFNVVTPAGLRAGRQGDAIAVSLDQNEQDLGIRHSIPPDMLKRLYRKDGDL